MIERTTIVQIALFVMGWMISVSGFHMYRGNSGSAVYWLLWAFIIWATVAADKFMTTTRVIVECAPK